MGLIVQRGRSAVLLLTGFAMGLAVSVMAHSASVGVVAGGHVVEAKELKPSNRGLDANLFMQTSAEYRACCVQTYNLALQSLKAKVERAGRTDKPLAVVCDLDETILDNAGFQSYQVIKNIGFDKTLWDQWQGTYHTEVGLVPGAKEFILQARALGVEHVFISNRDETYRKQTKEVLTRLGMPIEVENQLKLATTTSDKTRRRLDAEAEYHVLMYFGDNLRDFDDVFKAYPLAERTVENCQKLIAARKQAVDERVRLFGDKWFILPNPVYGEWPAALMNTKEDEKLLRKSPLGGSGVVD